AAAFFGADLAGNLVAVELGQHDVEDHQVGMFQGPLAERLRAVPGRDHLVAFLVNRVGQEALDVRVVIDDEDLGGHGSFPRELPAPTTTPRPRAVQRPEYRVGLRPSLRPMSTSTSCRAGTFRPINGGVASGLMLFSDVRSPYVETTDDAGARRRIHPDRC